MNLEEVKRLQSEFDWYHHPRDYVALYDWTKELNPRVIAETGTKKGFSGMIMKKACPSSRLITIDNLQDTSESELGIALPEDVIQVRGEALEELPRVLEEYKPEQVFLDDGHSYNIVKRGIEQSISSAVSQIIVHDVEADDEVKRAVEEAPVQAEVMSGSHGIARLVV